MSCDGQVFVINVGLTFWVGSVRFGLFVELLSIIISIARQVGGWRFEREKLI